MITGMEEMTKEKTAWCRGKKVAELGHSLSWYKAALEAYSEPERKAFLDGFNGLEFK